MSQKHYTQLSYEERVLIEDWNKDVNPNKLSLRKFAEHLGRHPSTISRELDRNGRPPTTHKTRVNKPRFTGHSARCHPESQAYIEATARYWIRRNIFLSQSRRHYTAKAAEKNTYLRTKRPGLKLEQPDSEELLSFVLTALDSRWSPEQISGRIKHEGILPTISHESIYSFIRKHKAIKDIDLTSCLRRKGKKYRKQKVSTYNHTDNRKSIDERPEAVAKLTRVGDLEGDTIVGKDQKDRLLTHNDRLSGKVSISKILGFTAEYISKQAIDDIERVFTDRSCSGKPYTRKCHTITYDNGVEHSCWHRTETKLSTSIYFAHPYHSWERSRNENANGLIRDFLPKGTDFKTISDNDILMIESLLNNRPRKRLDWLTPNEFYDQHVHNASVAVEG